MTRLVIIGAGGHGRVTADAAMLLNKWSEIVFFDDIFPQTKSSSIWPIIGNLSEARVAVTASDDFVVAIGNAKLRQEFLTRFSGSANPISIVHPSAVVSPRAEIGRGCVIFAGAVINIGARLGDGIIVNTGATVDHDCVLGDFSHICPGVNIAGDVVVGERSWIGIGATVKQGLIIGRDVMVGAGATVISDVPDATTVVGTPARALAK